MRGLDRALRGWQTLLLLLGAQDAQGVLQYVYSSNSLLDTTLRVQQGVAYIDGRPVNNTITYNGLYPGPTLVARRGDRVRILLHNDLVGMTINIHYHGLHVSPEGTADNVEIIIQPGQSFQYDFIIPINHDQGLFWYHSHIYGQSDMMATLGLSGMFLVRGGAGACKALRDTTHVLMGINQIQVNFTDDSALYPPPAPNSQQLYPVNGDLMPVFHARPGETQYWQLVNLGSNSYFTFAVEGHTFTVMETDGASVWKTWEESQLFMIQGSRFGVAITASLNAGNYIIRSNGFNGGIFQDYPPQNLAILRVEGNLMHEKPLRLPRGFPKFPRELMHKVAAYRTVILSEAAPNQPPAFYVNGLLYPQNTPETIFQTVLGTVEEWLVAVSNDPGTFLEPHVYHLHTNAFVVTGTGTWDYQKGVLSHQKIKSNGTNDVVFVNVGEYVTLRTKYEDFTGRPMQHCHLLFHEDFGMMAPFMINAQANATICQSNYDTGVASCGVNYPAAFQPDAHARCLRKVAQADRRCRKLIPRRRHSSSKGRRRARYMTLFSSS